MSGLGAALIEDGSSDLEKLMSDVEAEELLRIEAELIEENWDPYRVKARNLLFLAFSYGVQLWDDKWPEETKRWWIAEQWRFKAKRGTEPAFRMALSLWGYELVEVLTPPQGFYASEDFSTEERNAWIERMPTLRIRLNLAHGYGWRDDWFAGQSFAGEAFATADDARTLYARRGFLRKDGVDTPLDSVILSTTVTNNEVTDVEQISIPGRSTVGFFAGVDFAGDDHYAGSAEVEAKLVTVSKTQSYEERASEYVLTTATPGLVPLEQSFKQESEIGNGGPYFYAGDFAGHNFAGHENAGDLLVDVMHLFDPDIALPMVEGASFAGVDRSGIEPQTLEMLIDLKLKAEPLAWIAGRSFAGEAAAVDQDLTAMDNALRACNAAKSLRDRVLVSFAPIRPLRPSDRVDETTRAGAWVRDRL